MLNMLRVQLRYASHLPSSLLPLLFFSPFPTSPNTPQATIGQVTGLPAWKASGDKDKTEAVDAMKAASANRDPAQKGFGGIEEKAGNMVGCEGMQKEGAESKKVD
jgi:hypothetical protein